MRRIILYGKLFLLIAVVSSQASAQGLWHNIERQVHYTPDGEDFLLVNGTRRFNRALYGGNSAFRAEAGDLPEFALYLPGMGGSLRFGLIGGTKSKWIIDADEIQTRYRPGSMLYVIRDSLLGPGTLSIIAMALFDTEGLIIRIEAKDIPAGIQLVSAYGGPTGQRFSRDGDIGADPESSFYLKPEYCTDNFYIINKNSFRVFFGSRRPLSEEERYEIQHLPASRADTASNRAALKTIGGWFPPGAHLKLSDAAQQQSPIHFLLSDSSAVPALCAGLELTNKPLYFLLQNGRNDTALPHQDPALMFQNAENARKQLAARIEIKTPDPFINPVAGSLSIAADAIWEAPSYLHGSVAWRMRLNGWRGAYTANVLGWHDRAKMHCSSYARSQVTTPLSAPVVMDTALHLARGLEKMGTSLFSSGYISRNPGGDKRPHHYDMNLVFVDQLIDHFLWTGDTSFVKEMWPLLERHLQWEKRNFDADGDGLYDAYAAIWASDALQYSGGGVTHTSAYNYRANTIAAQLAGIIGKDGTSFQKEAEKIKRALNNRLWLNDRGWYGEYRDLLGNQLVHPSAGVWTIYHAMESGVPDPFQSWQMMQYVNKLIPRIPIKASGLNDWALYTISTTNWQPYTWSLNNVALAEILHTSLAYWQAGMNEEAHQLWRSALIESMYLGASPGNFQQLSFYDAVRGELYRDFADVVGMASRSLVQGLFGIQPDMLHGRLVIRPGFPNAWTDASIKTPDIELEFRRKEKTDFYRIITHFKKSAHLQLEVAALFDDISFVKANGKNAGWKFVESVGRPLLVVSVPLSDSVLIEIGWSGKKIEGLRAANKIIGNGSLVEVIPSRGRLVKYYDPQRCLKEVTVTNNRFTALSRVDQGHKTFFIKVEQGKASFWIPVSFTASPAAKLAVSGKPGNPSAASIEVSNNANTSLTGRLVVNHQGKEPVTLMSHQQSGYPLPAVSKLLSGTNLIQLHSGKQIFTEHYVNWDIQNPSTTQYDRIDLSAHFNNEVNRIFKEQYLSPRPTSTTLQLPTQGIGNWAYPLTEPFISDSGLRVRAGVKNEIVIQQGIPFRTPAQPGAKNIVFTSKWKNYPSQVSIPLAGKASHSYFLMAGSTNAMQSRITNGVIMIQYKDGSADSVLLKNPQNWWPIEQDYIEDGFAFTTDAPKPVRVYLYSGEDTRTFDRFVTIRGFSNRGIHGGAATVIDLPLDPSKELKLLTLKTIANDVVIGLMSITLVR